MGQRVLVAGPPGDVDVVARCVRERGDEVLAARDVEAIPEGDVDACLITRATVVDRLVPRGWAPLAGCATVGVFVQARGATEAPMRAWVTRTLASSHSTQLHPSDRLELPRRVREAVRSCWPTTDRLDVVVLAASELASNAVQHSAAAPTATVACDGGRLLVELVDDRPHDLPCLADPHADHPADGLGHGLRIVAAIADRWGVTVRPTSKIVWCEFDQHPRV